jgi:N-acetylneuraminic acid mutarotase
VAVLNGRIYAVGGQTDCRAATASVEAYDPLSDTWTVQPPLPSERSGHVVAAVNGKLYAIGGHTSDGVPLNFNTEFDPEKKTWTEMTPMPTPRYAATVTVVNGLIYVMGGGAQSGTQAIVEAYDPATDMWTQKRPMLKPRMSFAAAEVNETIYAFGGGGNRFQVEAYNPATDSWTVVARMPIRAFNVHAATLGGSIYIAGGSGGSDYRSTVMAFTPSNNIARESVACSKIQVAQKAEMPIIRGSMAVGEINGIVYVVGGYEKNARYLSANEAYDPATDKWKTKAPMPAARETTGTNSAVVNEKLYVIGGNASGYCSNRNEAYDPTTDSWKVMSPMPTPRCHLAVVANNGLIYAVGGTNTNGSIQYDVMEVYDPNTDKWTTAPPMPTPRMFLGAASLNGIVYVLGGANPALSDSGHLGTLEAYDPNSNTWTTKTPMPTPRDAFVAGVLNGSIMVLGGRHDETTIATVEAYDPLRDRWTTHENLATPRAFSSGLSVGDTLYVFGGKGPEEPKTPLPTEAFSLIACSD